MVRLVALLLLVAPAIPARAGVVVQMDENGTPERLSTEGKRFRADRGGDRPSVTIFDGERHVLYELDPQARTYRRLDQASARAMGAQLSAALEAAKQRMTPEQRAQLEKLEAEGKLQPGAGASPPAPRYEPMGKGDTVAGHACQWYRVVRDGRTSEQACYIPWSAGVLQRSDLAALEEMGKFSDEMLAGMAAGAGQPPSRGGGARLAHDLEKGPGFPGIVQHLSEDGKVLSTDRLVSVKRTAVPADQFAVPAGFTERPLMEPSER
jgi:hypothetical protein